MHKEKVQLSWDVYSLGIISLKLIIWLKDFNNPEKEPVEFVYKYRLEKIKETEIAFIYRNPGAYGRRIIPRLVILDKKYF